MRLYKNRCRWSRRKQRHFRSIFWRWNASTKKIASTCAVGRTVVFGQHQIEHQIVMEEMKSMMEANHLKQIKLLEISKNQPANKVKYVWPDLEISMPGPVDIEAFDNFK